MLMTCMTRMFYGCNQLKYIDLSNFDTSNVEDMNGMFDNCTSLEFLDISNFKVSKVNCMESMFNEVNKLKYISIYNIQYNEYFKSNISNEFHNTNYLIVCQNEDIITNENIINACCDYNNNNLKCNPLNYITVYYSKDIIYQNGFKNNNEEVKEYRKGVDLINNDTHTIFSSSEYLEIKLGSKLEISLSKSSKSLANFFDSNYDENLKYIISIDLSHLDSSKITNMNSLFKDCNSLETIIFTGFNTSIVSNMSEIFSGCSALKELDLNNFITNSVTDMNKMFYGCDNLKYLDISQFNISSNDIFNDLKN